MKPTNNLLRMNWMLIPPQKKILQSKPAKLFESIKSPHLYYQATRGIFRTTSTGITKKPSQSSTLLLER